MRWITIEHVETSGALGAITSAVVEALTQMIGRTRSERRDVRQQLRALAADHLAEEQCQRAAAAKAKRPRCRAVAASTGRPCQAMALPPDGRCLRHQRR